MAPVLYTGPDDQINYDVAEATGGPITLEHGKTYDVNADLADRLVESSVWFERVGPPSKDELVAHAVELGIENPGKLGKQALAAAIAEAEAALSDSAGITGTDGEVSPDA